jgi:hypothetical protein
MDREQLEHAIRAACNISEDDELYIFGSQAILGQYPDAAQSLRRSIEVDVSPKNKPEMVDKIDGALGENSPFHKTHGFYVHGVSLETAVLPEGWEERTIAISDYLDERKKGRCLEAHDLAASKLIAFREKDRYFVRTLLMEGLVQLSVLPTRLEAIGNHQNVRERALRWCKKIAHELG